jgi:hypothetical protein
MEIPERLKLIRETLGILPNDELYEFAQAVIEDVINELAKNGKPLTLSQVAIVSEYFE